MWQKIYELQVKEEHTYIHIYLYVDLSENRELARSHRSVSDRDQADEITWKLSDLIRRMLARTY